MTGAISRCTQNTAFMEEWRKGWHPDRARPKGASETVLIVGAGPTGLEAALQAAKRGYKVTWPRRPPPLAAASPERHLPGLSAWGRVADYRTGQLAPLPNVEIYRDSRLTAEDILAMGVPTTSPSPPAATWRRDAVARLHLHPIPTDPAMPTTLPMT